MWQSLALQSLFVEVTALVISNGSSVGQQPMYSTSIAWMRHDKRKHARNKKFEMQIGEAKKEISEAAVPLLGFDGRDGREAQPTLSFAQRERNEQAASAAVDMGSGIGIGMDSKRVRLMLTWEEKGDFT